MPHAQFDDLPLAAANCPLPGPLAEDSSLDPFVHALLNKVRDKLALRLREKNEKNAELSSKTENQDKRTVPAQDLLPRREGSNRARATRSRLSAPTVDVCEAIRGGIAERGEQPPSQSTKPQRGDSQ